LGGVVFAVLRDGSFQGSRPLVAPREQRLREEDDLIGLDIEAEHRMSVVSLRIHQHRLAQPPSDRPKEVAEHIESFLALQLPQVDIEVDFVVGMETEDRENLGSRPDP
jgi:hypothetical protein